MKNCIQTIQQWLTVCVIVSLTGSLVNADEGMWQPHQLPELAPRMQELGLAIPPKNLSELGAFPMNAIVSLGGCSASFVSPEGLVVTNHHCIYGSVQFNSTEKNNLFRDGFLAEQKSKELPAAPGTRVYVTESLTDVTQQVLADVTPDMSGKNRYDTIESAIKKLVKDCEKSGMHRCDVPAFHHGLEYFLIKRLEIRDVRLVYAPATSVGKYGGDIDNWMWPRHTGDFGFYRAYVGKNGKPADFDKANVPYKPASFLKVSAKPLNSGDFVMAAGYPGRTNRYRTTDEILNQFTWYYPEARTLREDLIDIIQSHTEEGSDAALRYENIIAGLSNYAKNFQSMVESYRQSDYLERRENFENAMQKWLQGDATRSEEYGPAVENLRDVVSRYHQTRERDLILGYLYYATMPRAAFELYRWAQEQQKPDSEREPGYQERDRSRFEQSMKRMSRRYVAEVDRAILAYLLKRYAALPEAQRVSSIDRFFKLEAGSAINEKKLTKQLQRSYKKTELDQEETRLAWMDRSVDAFKDSNDPFIKMAVATYPERKAMEDRKKELAGQEQYWRSQYMAAVIAYNRSLNRPIYSDANSTLRVTFGQVLGNQPRDGLRNAAFTTLEGIVEKDTGESPFDAPKEQLELIRQEKYGPYYSKSLDSVPVNFLCTLDITGGNSGSAALNKNAELVGLLFDGVYESIIGDWDFNDEKNRAIAVDTRYMLWVMKYLDGADNLLEEMDIVY